MRTQLWEMAEAALKQYREKDEFRQKNHMVHAGRRKRVGQVRAFGTSEGATKRTGQLSREFHKITYGNT